MRNTIQTIRLLFTLAMSLAIAGCSPPENNTAKSDDAAESNGSKSEGSKSDDSEAFEDNVTQGGEKTGNKDDQPGGLLEIQPVSKIEFDEFVAANSGKVIVVDFWATWCEPCKKAFPHTVELANKYAGSDVVVVSMSFDMAGSEAQAAQFVTNQQADEMKHFISNLSMTESFNAYDIKEGIPEYRIFDKLGKQRYIFRVNAEGDDEPVENLDIRIREVLDES